MWKALMHLFGPRLPHCPNEALRQASEVSHHAHERVKMAAARAAVAADELADQHPSEAERTITALLDRMRARDASQP